MKEFKKEVIIVGGGPAGSFTALHLASMFPELAEDIVLLEAKRQGRKKICAGGVSGRVMMGAKADLGIDLSSLPGKDSEGLIIKFKDKVAVAERPGIGRVIRRETLDSFLLDRVRERGVTVLTETPVTDIVRVPRGISAETRNGTFTGRVLVGADGMNGITKKALKVDYGKHKEYLYMVDLPAVDVPPYFMLDFSPTLAGVPGYMWMFPEEKGANAGITGGAPGGMGYLKKQLLGMLEKNLDGQFDPGKLKFKVYPERFFSFSTPSRAERVLFVGDKLGAAPMTGEGIGIAFCSGKAAAREIMLALGSGDYSFKHYPRRLLTSDFVPTWAMERVLYYLKSPGLFHLFFLLVTTENRPEGDTFMDYFCKLFAGQLPSQSLAGWASLRKALPSARLLGNELKSFADKMF